jgi:hypothetical protein
MQEGSAAVADDGGGDGEQAISEAFGFPTPGFVFGVSQECVPDEQVGSERDNLAPDLILSETFHHQLGVLVQPPTTPLLDR